MSSTSQIGVTTTFGYDALQRQIAQTDGRGNTTHTVYDNLGRVASSIDALGYSTTYGYDALGRQTSVTDPLTNTVTTAYDAEGHVVSQRGAILEVAESATFALGGSLALKSGSKLAFNFTGRSAPVLDMTGKTVAFTEAQTTNVIVKVSAADALRPMSGKRQLTAGYDFTGVNVSLAEGAPEWVKNIGLDDEGNIFIDVEPEPFVILVR